MRKGMTLIELIFAMVIISIVFSVVPKIIYVSNKSMALSMKEDALFNAYTLMGSISKLSWDENTLDAGKILGTTETGICDNNRTGGFSGSRNCIGSDLNATTSIGIEDTNEDGNTNDEFNDIDDYSTYNEDVNVSGKNRYKISVDVNYVKDDYTNPTAGTTELKEIKVIVASHDDNKKMKSFQSSFFYYSANLGHIQIKKELW